MLSTVKWPNIIFCLVLTSIFSIGKEARAMVLAQRGAAKCAIVVAADATAPEKTAANELRDYLAKVTGAEFKVTSESPAGSPRILVGQSAEVLALLPEVDWKGLGTDGIVIKSVGNTLVLAGGRPRGTIYAVYTFLEDVVGCRWWTSTESLIPKKPTLRIADLDIVQLPAFRYRETFYRETMASPDLAVKLRLNGHFMNISPEYGDHLSFVYFVHSFFQILPPEKYFAQHPEWYSEIGGTRTAERTQLCLTNDEMRAELTRLALDQIRKSPNAGIISISQNDSGGRCQCAKCKAIEDYEGSPSGPVIHFVNAVARDIEKEFPDVLVETLAYQYTRKPPLHVKPRRNVVVRLCTIECAFNQTLESPANKEFMDDICGWRAIARNLYVWDYVANFGNFLVPHPNMQVLAPNLRFFARSNVIGMFEQGDGYSPAGDFVRLRAWLIAHLLWDPSRDENALIKEFVRGYYGAAAPSIAKYLDIVRRSGERANRPVGWFDNDPCLLSLDDMNQATRLFDKAQKAVAGDKDLSLRVRRERIPLDHLWLIRGSVLKMLAEKSHKAYLGPKDTAAAGDEFVRTVREFPVNKFTELLTFDSYEPALRRKISSVVTTDKCKLVTGTGKIELQDGLCVMMDDPEWMKHVDDPLASDGSAAKMPGNSRRWANKFIVTQDIVDALPGKWHCYAVARCEADRKTGEAFAYGLAGSNGKDWIEARTAQLEVASDGQYHAYDLGVHEIKNSYVFWFAGPGADGGVKAVYADCIVLVPAK